MVLFSGQLRKVFEFHFGINGMNKQFFNPSPPMGEASAMGGFLQDRTVFRMLRPCERSHAKET
ncbi:MAG: hypothetical protein BGO78_00800 [Chloroflexi bacterium 44-23]|nr:MAG: hypothetical protein BGO78_00800 [Chloroflexi bacterium 44-23]